MTETGSITGSTCSSRPSETAAAAVVSPVKSSVASLMRTALWSSPLAPSEEFLDRVQYPVKDHAVGDHEELNRILGFQVWGKSHHDPRQREVQAAAGLDVHDLSYHVASRLREAGFLVPLVASEREAAREVRRRGGLGIAPSVLEDLSAQIKAAGLEERFRELERQSCEQEEAAGGSAGNGKAAETITSTEEAREAMFERDSQKVWLMKLLLNQPDPEDASLFLCFKFHSCEYHSSSDGGSVSEVAPLTAYTVNLSLSTIVALWHDGLTLDPMVPCSWPGHGEAEFDGCTTIHWGMEVVGVCPTTEWGRQAETDLRMLVECLIEDIQEYGDGFHRYFGLP